MNKSISVAFAVFLIAASALAESAHKGWDTDQWLGPSPSTAVIGGVGMKGPWGRSDGPELPTNAPFEGIYMFRTGSVVSVTKVYMLVANEEGTIKTREIKFTSPNAQKGAGVEGYSSASFKTEKLSFKEGDVFVVVFKADGKTVPVFLRLRYHSFVPS